MQLWEVSADVGVDRYHIPRCNHEVVEVGEGCADDVVKEVDLDVGRDGVEGCSLRILRDGLETELLARVGGVLDDRVAGFALLRLLCCVVSAYKNSSE